MQLGCGMIATVQMMFRAQYSGMGLIRLYRTIHNLIIIVMQTNLKVLNS